MWAMESYIFILGVDECARELLYIIRIENKYNYLNNNIYNNVTSKLDRIEKIINE